MKGDRVTADGVDYIIFWDGTHHGGDGDLLLIPEPRLEVHQIQRPVKSWAPDDPRQQPRITTIAEQAKLRQRVLGILQLRGGEWAAGDLVRAAQNRKSRRFGYNVLDLMRADGLIEKTGWGRWRLASRAA